MLVTLYQFDIHGCEYFSDRNLDALNKHVYPNFDDTYDRKGLMGKLVHEERESIFYLNSCVFGVYFSFNQSCQRCGQCRECNKYKGYDFVYCDKDCIYSVYHQDKTQPFIGEPDKKYFGGLINRTWLNKVAKFVANKEVNFILRVEIPGVYEHYTLPKPKNQQRPSFRMELIHEMSDWKVSELEEALRKYSNYDLVPENIITRVGPILLKKKKESEEKKIVDITLILIQTGKPIWYTFMEKFLFPGLWDNVLVVESVGNKIENVYLCYM